MIRIYSGTELLPEPVGFHFELRKELKKLTLMFNYDEFKTFVNAILGHYMGYLSTAPVSDYAHMTRETILHRLKKYPLLFVYDEFFIQFPNPVPTFDYVVQEGLIKLVIEEDL